MIKTLILDKSSVNAKYKYFDHYRYSGSENITNACQHYLQLNAGKYGVSSYQVVNVIEFKNTYHVKYETE